MQNVIAIDVWRTITGRAHKETSENLRANARVIASLIPQERLYEAEKLIRGDAAKADKPPGPELKDAPVKPEGRLRGSARRSKR